MLQDSGINITDNATKANCEILFDYGISKPQTINMTTVVPTYGVTGISSSTTTGNVFMQNNGFGNYYGAYSSQTNYNPQYGITGYTPTNITKIVYIRYLFLKWHFVILALQICLGLIKYDNASRQMSRFLKIQ